VGVVDKGRSHEVGNCGDIDSKEASLERNRGWAMAVEQAS
jgi:hypothetical protein